MHRWIGLGGLAVGLVLGAGLAQQMLQWRQSSALEPSLDPAVALQSEDRGAVGLSEEVTGHLGKRAAAGGAWSALGSQAIHQGPTFMRGLIYGLALPSAERGRLVVRDRERASIQDPWEVHVTIHEASFEILAVTAVALDEFLLLGRARNGDQLVERWHLPPVQGSWAQQPMQTGGLQVPVAVYGQVYVAPHQRPPQVLTRQELWRGSTPQHLVSLAADHEGTHLVLLQAEPTQATGGLWRLPLAGGQEPELVIDGATLPSLAFFDGVAARVIASTGERVLLLTAEGQVAGTNPPFYFEECLLIHDQNGDGIPEGMQSFPDYDTFRAAFPEPYVSLTDPLMHGAP